MSVFTKRVDANAGDFDSTYDKSGAYWSADINSAFNIGDPGAVLRNISLRFTNVTIPQGAVINSAKITFVSLSTKSPSVVVKIEGVDEDNTALYTDSGGLTDTGTARTRTKTTASVSWSGSISQTTDVALDTPDITAIVQEIVDRVGWASGNAMGFYLSENGSTSGAYLSLYEYNSSTTKCALLTIDYTAGSSSPSPSVSPSASQSPSSSYSPSSSVSPSYSPSSSTSRSPSPSPTESGPVLLIAKDTADALQTNDPRDFKFHSKYGTLKYFVKTQQILTVDGSAGDFSGRKTYTHNLGYYPYIEVFVRVYIGTPSGNYEYVPFFGSGATVEYRANYIIKENTIDLYGEFIGVSSSVWTFDFLLFLYKNNLGL